MIKSPIKSSLRSFGLWKSHRSEVLRFQKDRWPCFVLENFGLSDFQTLPFCVIHHDWMFWDMEKLPFQDHIIIFIIVDQMRVLFFYFVWLLKQLYAAFEVQIHQSLKWHLDPQAKNDSYLFILKMTASLSVWGLLLPAGLCQGSLNFDGITHTCRKLYFH